MSAPGFDTSILKRNAIAYMLEDPKMNWPVKVISAQRGAALGATAGNIVPIKGCVVSAKYVLGRSLDKVEKLLGLHFGELSQGAVLLKLNRLPGPGEFDLAHGYTNVAAYPGYPRGEGTNQWILTVEILATVISVAGPGGRL